MFCSFSGCNKKLRRDNKSGYCRQHRQYSLRKSETGRNWYQNNKERRSETGRNWYQNNKERKSETGRNWYQNNKKRKLETSQNWSRNNKERKLETERNWSQNNKARKQATNRDWYQNNKARKRETDALWNDKNRDKKRSYCDKRRTRILNQFGEEVDRFSIWCRDAGLCFLCGLPADKDTWWLEHVVPLSKGGLHCYENVAVSHRSCNQEKHDKQLEEWDLCCGAEE